MASIIEKETGRADERERIAGVFVNRLQKGMPLQSDPTILYGVYGGAVHGANRSCSRKRTQRTRTTRIRLGACPRRRSATQAAPRSRRRRAGRTNDLFFVADGSGGHVFTATLKDHNAAVPNWRKVEKDIRARQAKQDGPADAADKDASAAAKDDIPNPPAEAATTPEAAPATPAAAPAAVQASTMPLPVRKPKK